jgi:hypothetical protein
MAAPGEKIVDNRERLAYIGSHESSRATQLVLVARDEEVRCIHRQM